MKVKLVLEKVWVFELKTMLIGWKNQLNISKILPKTTNDIFSIQSKECSKIIAKEFPER